MNIRKQIRKEEAAVRAAEYSALTIEQKIARAAHRRGTSRKELARLSRLLAAQQEKAA